MKKSTLSLFTTVLAMLLLFCGCSGTDAVQTTTPDRTDAPENSATSAETPKLPTACFYLTGAVEPEQIAALFGQSYSPDLSRWFPVMKIDSAAALNEFCTEAGKIMSLDYDGASSFASAAAKYDDEYFTDHVLAVGCFWSSSQSIQYALTMYARVGSEITFAVSEYSLGYEPAVSGNLMVVELPRTELDGIDAIGGYQSEGNSNLTVEDMQSVVRIDYSGSYVFSGIDARKLTEDLSALSFQDDGTDVTQYDRSATVCTANGTYEYVIGKETIHHDGESAKFSMSGTLKSIIDHYPDTVVEDYIGKIGYLGEETQTLIEGFAVSAPDEMHPVIRLDSWEELTAFVAATDEEFRTAEDPAAKDAFIAAKIEEFGEDFFEGSSLLVSYFNSGSGSFQYSLTDASISADGTLTMEVRRKTTLDSYHTADMSGWIVAIRIPKDRLEGVTQYGTFIQ